MAERFFAVPDGFFHATNSFDSYDAAVEAAAPIVDRDSKARLIVRVVAEVRPLPAPRVEVVEVVAEDAEVAGG